LLEDLHVFLREGVVLLEDIQVRSQKVAYFSKIFKIVATPCGDFAGGFGAK